MAWPIHSESDQHYDFEAPTQLEKIPAGVPPSNIGHADLHTGNIMVGGPGGQFPEHSIFPATKLIDFGLTRRGDGGHEYNIFRISKVS